jgi:pimeloyl-ACP methyl ester carboxylesterase
MKIAIDQAKYGKVSPRLKERFFSFAESTELREIDSGAFPRQYLDAGLRDGVPILFFTGGIKFPVFSFAVIEAYSRTCRVIAPVQPRCSTLGEYFEGIDAILEKEKIDSFHIAGSSWGGQIAQVAALRYPDRVRKIIFANTGVSSGRLLAFLLRLHRKSSARKDPGKVAREFKDRAFKLLVDQGEAGEFWKAIFDDLYERSMKYEDYLSLIDTQIDYVENYASEVIRKGFAGPVLILASRDETAGSAKVRAKLLKAYPHAQVHYFESGGHHPALLNQEEYRRAVEDFLLDLP